EQGVIDEEYRVLYVLDRTNTFSKGILAITMECAQCHDHKYDPFSQQDYFELYAFFNNTPDKGLEITHSSQSKPAKFPLMTISNDEINSILTFINNPDTASLMVSVMEELRDTVRPTFVLNRGLYDSPGERVFPATPESILRSEERRVGRECSARGVAGW